MNRTQRFISADSGTTTHLSEIHFSFNLLPAAVSFKWIPTRKLPHQNCARI